MRRFYTVADFCFAVALAGDRDPDRYLASFAAFKSSFAINFLQMQVKFYNLRYFY